FLIVVGISSARDFCCDNRHMNSCNECSDSVALISSPLSDNRGQFNPGLIFRREDQARIKMTFIIGERPRNGCSVLDALVARVHMLIITTEISCRTDPNNN